MLPTSASPRKNFGSTSRSQYILSAPLAAGRSFYTRNSIERGQDALGSMRGWKALAPPPRSTVLFVGGCLLWYLASALASNTSKALMSSPKHAPHIHPVFPYPVTLTLVQFVFVHFFSQACASQALLGRHRLATIVKPNWSLIQEVGLVSGFSVIGHAMSALAISRVPVSSVHTIKALSPLFTVVSYKLMFGVSYSARTYLSLLPLTLGVMMACTGLSLSFDDIVGILAALGSTVVFVAQNIMSKKLISGTVTSTNPKDGRSRPIGAALDKLNFLYYSSGVSILLTLPLFFFTDFGRLFFYNATAHSAISESSNVASQSLFGAGFFVCSLLFANGVVHFSQSLLAFNILGLVSPVTYSIASLLKRVFVICFAIVWFQQQVSLLQWSGIVLTFLGLYMYNSTKTKSDVAKIEGSIRRQERRGSLALPTTQSEGLIDLDLQSSSSAHGRMSRVVPPLASATTHSGYDAHPAAVSPQHHQQLQHTHASNSQAATSHSKGFHDASEAGLGSDRSTPQFPHDPRAGLPSPPPSGRTSADAS